MVGVLWPVATILFELATHACGGAFFDPLPTWVNVLAVLSVPGIGLRAWWRSGLANPPPVRPWERCWLGVAWAVATFYTVSLSVLNLYAIMMLPFALLGFAQGQIFAFLPALTLGPLLGWAFLWRARRHLQTESKSRLSSDLSFVVALLVLAVVEIPAWVTVQATRQAEAASSIDRAGLAMRVRKWGSERTLHAAAYGNTKGNSGPWIWILNGGLVMGTWDSGPGLDSSLARELYYRAYGRLFTDSPPRMRNTMLGDGEGRGPDSTDGFAWDGDVGGTTVGGAKMKGLRLQGSRMDWHLDEASRLAYGEWTLEFYNRHANAQEARCQMLLPPGAFVSRLTLWVNGEPREAAFAGQAKVREAYQKVAVQERRDPVLVTQVGPDRVLTQCFPVPADGSIKIRLGITAPLPEGVLHLPLLLERNFMVMEVLRHAVDVQSASAFSAGSSEATAASGQPHRWRAELKDADLAMQNCRLTSLAKPEALWCEDPLAGDKPRFVTATPRETAGEPVKKWIVVIDGSESLRPRLNDVQSALEHLRQKSSVHVLIAVGGGYEELGKDDTPAASAFRGGSDNSAALTHALDLARTEPGTEVLWLHGLQPFAFADLQALQQLIERSHPPLRLHALALVQGPNRFLESLSRHASVQSPARCPDLPSLLAALDLCSGLRPNLGWDYTRGEAAPAAGKKVWEHLARAAVFDEVMKGYQNGAATEGLAALGAQHHLVTPVSGAVVLETLEQYRAAGLDPGDPNASPKIPLGIPEPSRSLLVMMGIACLILRRRRE